MNKLGEWRIGNVRKTMTERNVDVVLAYATEQDTDDLHWISGYDNVGSFSLLLLPKEEDPTLLIGESRDLERAYKISWVEDIRVSADFPSDCASILNERKLKPSSICMMPSARGRGVLFSRKQFEAFTRQLHPAKIVVDNKIFERRAFHCEEEVEWMRKSVWLAEQCFEAVWSLARPGLKIFELAAEFDYICRRNGGSSAEHLIGVGPQPLMPVFNYPPRPTSYAMKKGDLLLLESFQPYRNQSSHFPRTAILGRASKETKRCWDAGVAALNNTIEFMKPGVTSEECFYACDKPLIDAGFSDYLRLPYRRSRGHPTPSYEIPGDMIPGNKAVLQETFITCPQPNQYYPKVGYLLLGDPVIVVKSGAKRLTNYSTELMEIS